MSMTRVLFVDSDRRSAKRSFDRTLETLKWLSLNGVFASHSIPQMYIHVGNVRYEFVSTCNLDDHLLGREFDGILVDELVSLTDDQKVRLNLCNRNKNTRLGSL